MPSVLAIDDDRSVLHLIKETFKGSNIDVLSAPTAAEGLSMVSQHQPDVVLLDVMLPETSGLETFEKIRKIDNKLPVIFITASGTSDTAIEAMKGGAYDYLPKP